MGVGATVSSRARFQADSPGFLGPFFYTDFVAIEARLTPNYGEFAVIRTRVVNRFPVAEEFDGISISKPVRAEEIPILSFEHVG